MVLSANSSFTKSLVWTIILSLVIGCHFLNAAWAKICYFVIGVLFVMPLILLLLAVVFINANTDGVTGAGWALVAYNAVMGGALLVITLKNGIDARGLAPKKRTVEK